ncbi:hypothetical protein [Escherichia coli]|uniref:hypothetical protein n=2 Tax=Escherichia coli TaxID=562 RepID=UPI00032478AC|nr:hypothetical protein [Escherichia coli]
MMMSELFEIIQGLLHGAFILEQTGVVTPQHKSIFIEDEQRTVVRQDGVMAGVPGILKIELSTR